MTVHLKHFKIALPLLLTVLMAGPVTGGEKPKRGEVRAVMVEKGPTIDGTLKDPLWEKAAVLPLGNVTDAKPGKYETSARLLIDKQFLYIAVVCAEPKTDSIKATIKDLDGNVWADDCVELFIAPQPEKNYKHIAINAKNISFDQMVTKSEKDPLWNIYFTSKISIQKDKCWIVTMAMPLKDLGVKQGKDQTIRLNITRTRHRRGDDGAMEWSWAVMPSTDFHRHNAHGKVEGVEITPKAFEDIPGHKRDAWAPDR